MEDPKNKLDSGPAIQSDSIYGYIFEVYPKELFIISKLDKMKSLAHRFEEKELVFKVSLAIFRQHQHCRRG